MLDHFRLCSSAVRLTEGCAAVPLLNLFLISSILLNMFFSFSEASCFGRALYTGTLDEEDCWLAVGFTYLEVERLLVGLNGSREFIRVFEDGSGPLIGIRGFEAIPPPM